MAQDYHIYLHGAERASGGNQTKPFSTRKEEDRSFSSFSTLASTSSTMAKGQMASTGASAITKAVPWVAAIVAAVKVVDHVLSTGFEHQEEYTGNFRNNVNYNNFKTILHNVVNPINFVLRSAHQNAQYRKQNIEIEQQRNLIGDSILKDFNIGV